jgi:hypothetical protein
LLLLVPAHKALFGRLDRKLQHYRRYSKKELIVKLTDAGFIIDKVEYMNFLSAIGWFIQYKVVGGKRMPKLKTKLLDKLIPVIAWIEKHISFPFGLSLLAIAKTEKN